MTAISSLGIGSNLDLTTLLANLKTGEQAPLVALQKQQTSYTAKLSAYGQLNSALSALQSASEALAKPALFTGVNASSSNTGVVSATAAAGAPSGVYAVNVTTLAQAQSLATGGVASSTAPIGAGALGALSTNPTTVTIEFGTIATSALPDPITGKYTVATPDSGGKYSGAFFIADSSRTAASINITPTNNTLAGIRDAINASTSIGVTASIVNDGSSTPNRLVLTSKTTGETSSMHITVSGDSAISTLLSNNPGGAESAQLQQTVTAQNTKLTVNGIAVTSATSSVAGAIQDVSMTVNNVGTSTLTVQSDTGSVQNAITAFVKAYNNLQSVAGKLSAFDATSKAGAVLLGDSVLRNIRVGIRSTLTSAQDGESSALTMLSQIGVSFQKDGTLAIDSPNSADATNWSNPIKLSAVLGSNLSGVAKLFSGTNGAGGYGTQMAALISSYTDSDGALSAATKGINSRLDKLSERYTATSERIDATVARYKAQFTQLDLMMSRMTATSTYLTQQFDALNNTSKN